MLFPLSAFLRLLLVASVTAIAGPSTASAQDRLIFKDNHVQDGQIIGMNGSTVLIRMATSTGAAGQMGFDQALLSRIDAPTPIAFQTAFAAYASGDWDRALAALKPLVDQFRGLPTDWARQATGMLGDLYIEKNDVAHAEAAYNDFHRLYPGGADNTLRTNLGQARISLARNNFAQARQQLDPLTQAALKSPAEVPPLDGAMFGQAFYVSGQLHEREGKFQAALEDYLRTVTLFYQDNSVTTRAQQSADALRAAHKEVSAP